MYGFFVKRTLLRCRHNRADSTIRQLIAILLLFVVNDYHNIMPAAMAIGAMDATAAVDLTSSMVESEEGFCAPYNGKVCRSFMRSGQVWFSRVDPNYGWENEKITAGLWEEMIGGLSGHCRTAAEVQCSVQINMDE